MQTLSEPLFHSSTTRYCTELQVLLYCAHTEVDPAIANQLQKLLQQDVDWSVLVQMAAEQRVLPLLYWNLARIAPDVVPSDILKTLQTYFQANAQRNLFRTGEMLNVLNAFTSQNMTVIPYKGAVLATQVYGNPALRQFDDLDFLVSEQDFVKATDLLISQGYELLRNYDWELHLINPISGINIDLHKGLVPDFFAITLNLEQFQPRLQTTTIANTPIAQLAPEDLLLILCLQVCKDYCQAQSRLAQLCDIAEFLRAYPDLNWQQVMARFRQYHVERILLLSLNLVHQLLQVKLPDLIVETLHQHPVVQELTQEACSKLFYQSREPKKPIEEYTFWWGLWNYDHRFYIRMRERRSDLIVYGFCWLRLCLRFALTPNEKDFEVLPLPRPLFFLYYPLHLSRLLLKHGLGSTK